MYHTLLENKIWIMYMDYVYYTNDYGISFVHSKIF